MDAKIIIFLLQLLLGLLLSSLALPDSTPQTHHQDAGSSSDHPQLENHLGLMAVKTGLVVLRGRKMGEAKRASTGQGCRREMKVECDKAKGRGGVVSSRAGLVGYVPFSLDYYNPRTHPPKNN